MSWRLNCNHSYINLLKVYLKYCKGSFADRFGDTRKRHYFVCFISVSSSYWLLNWMRIFFLAWWNPNLAWFTFWPFASDHVRAHWEFVGEKFFFPHFLFSCDWDPVEEMITDLSVMRSHLLSLNFVVLLKICPFFFSVLCLACCFFFLCFFGKRNLFFRSSRVG